jgi:hypothetical protein
MKVSIETEPKKVKLCLGIFNKRTGFLYLLGGTSIEKKVYILGGERQVQVSDTFKTLRDVQLTWPNDNDLVLLYEGDSLTINL